MKHFIKYTQVFPVGYADPERLEQDPDYIPGKFGRVEEYDLKLSNTAPIVGDIINGWTIVQIEEYQADDTGAQFYVAICTLDGVMPDRRVWYDSGTQILTFYLEGDDFVRNEDGSAMFEISERLLVKPALSFKPKFGRPIAGYDLVAVA